MIVKLLKEITKLTITCSMLALLVLLVASCKTGSRAATEKIVAGQLSIKPSDSLLVKQKKGIDIYASGITPAGWWLELDFDKTIDFISKDGINVHILTNFSKRESTPEKETFIAPTDLGPLEINLYQAACSDKTANGSNGKRVEVILQGKTYSGCGSYLFNNQLHDIWELEYIDNILQKHEDFQKGLPTLQFDLINNSMKGNDGCNNIRSTIEVKGNGIRFGVFSGTKMACNNNRIQQVFATLLSDHLVNYRMENNKLVFYLYDDSRLTFKRKEF